MSVAFAFFEEVIEIFLCYEKILHSPFLPLHRQNKEVWVSGLNQHTANVPNRKVPKVRILLLPHFGSLAQLGQSTAILKETHLNFIWSL